MAKEFICASCGSPGKPKNAIKGSIVVEIILWFSFLIPGLIYSIWRLTTCHEIDQSFDCKLCCDPEEASDVLLGCRDDGGLPGADGGNRMPRYIEFFLHCPNAGTLCQSLDTLMVYLRSISEHPLSRVNGWAGLLGGVNFRWEITWMV